MANSLRDGSFYGKGCYLLRDEQPNQMSNNSLNEAAKAIAAANKILVFTGAGMSTGSGIADFRGPQGVWKRRQPVYIDDFLARHEARLEYWDYKREGYASFKAAQPNQGHLALVHLEKAGRLCGLVTQNVDGLHSIAGNSDDKVVEIHGTNRKVACLSCTHSEDPGRAFEEFDRTLQPPKCPACGGWLKPATISFGQALRQEDLEKAAGWAQGCDFVMSLGSTLSVHPAASIPLMAQQNGSPYLVINRGATDHDSVADFRLEGELTELLPSLLAP
jgi:NAD-dependent protein deacetylase/lipoamidase